MVDAGSSMDWKSAHGLFAEVATILDTNKPRESTALFFTGNICVVMICNS